MRTERITRRKCYIYKVQHPFSKPKKNLSSISVLEPITTTYFTCSNLKLCDITHCCYATETRMDWTKPSIHFLISSGLAPTSLSTSAPSLITKKVGIAFISSRVATSYENKKKERFLYPYHHHKQHQTFQEFLVPIFNCQMIMDTRQQSLMKSNIQRR